MKHWKALFVCILLTNCASYKPIVDTAGRSGTFNENKADQISNDLQHCEYQAKKHTKGIVEASKKGYNFLIRPKLLWLSPKAKDKYKIITDNCLTNRGHSVLSK